MTEQAPDIQELANNYIAKLLKQSGRTLKELTPTEQALYALLVLKIGKS